MRHRNSIIGGAVVAALAVFALAAGYTARDRLFSGAWSGGQCSAAEAMRAAVEENARGDMAAMTTGPALDVSALRYDGEATLADFSGRTILLNLWATWCAPCRAEMPSLAALHEAMASEAFSVIAVSIDHNDAGRPEAFLAETNATALDYHREPTLSLFNTLREADLAYGMPTTLLVAPDGCVAGVLHGAAHWDSPDAKRLIGDALATLS